MTRNPTRRPKPRHPRRVVQTRRTPPAKPQRKTHVMRPAKHRTTPLALVTGGAGFIGSHLCDRLIADGFEVLCLDNFYTGSAANLQHFKHEPRFDLITHDVVEPYDARVARVYNLACPASPVHYQADPIKTYKTSILGALHALEVGRRHGARVFQASTSEVYGDPEQHPQQESYWGHVNPIGIRACYDEGKRGAETLFFDYARRHKTDIRVARIFNTYGPRMLPNDGRVVSNFIVQALADEPFTIYGDGSQTRSFCYVDDLIDGIMLLTSDAGIPGPVNLGNPSEFTMGELADKVLALTGSHSHRVFKALPSDDPTRRRPDISLAQQKLGWSPKVSLEEGLLRTIGYFRSVMSIA